MNKIDLEQKVSERFSIRELSEFFNLSYTTIRYWLKKYNLKTDGYKMSYVWEKSILEKIVSENEYKSDVLRALNISLKSGNFQTLDKYCKKYNIDTSHFKTWKNIGRKLSVSDEEMFSENSVYARSTVKKRIIKRNLIPYQCNICENDGIWNGKKLSLQLEHKNGKNNDNRLENLCFLCPNCHSQTDTFGSKNKKSKWIHSSVCK